MRRRAGELSITYLLLIVVGLLVIWFVIIPLIARAWTGAKSLNECNAECFSDCPTGYARQPQGDIGCSEKDATRGMCCEALKTGANQVANSGDIRLKYGNKETLVANGETLTLAADATQASGKFSLAFGPTVKDKKCYWRVGNEETQKDVFLCGFPKNGNVFENLFDNYKSFLKNPGAANIETGCGRFQKDLKKACSDFAGTRDLVIKDSANGVLPYLGLKQKYTLMVVDTATCQPDDDVDSCSTYAFTFYLQVPDRNPAITLTIDGAPASAKTMTALSPGEHDARLLINEPFSTCSATYALSVDATPPDGVEFLSSSGSGASVKDGKQTLLNEPNCFASKKYDKQFKLTIPQDAVRAIPFTITANTSLSAVGGAAAAVRSRAVTYPLQVAPDDRVKVNGPAPGLTKEKVIDVTCDKVTCTSFTMAHIRSPFDCRAQTYASDASIFAAPPGLVVYGETGSNRWRFTLANESMSGDYLCVRAETTQGAIYSLGLWNSLPQPITIDHTPPTLVIGYNPLEGKIDLTCADDGGRAAYQSKCKARPYSYSYVVDPLKFIATVVTGGALASTFSACPPADQASAQTSYGSSSANQQTWITHNSDQPMSYLGRDIRVLCVRATDNAGNSVVESKLLYNGQEALALLLKEFGKTALPAECATKKC